MDKFSLYSQETVLLQPDEIAILKTDLVFQIPKGHIALIFSDNTELRVLGYENRVDETTTDFYVEIYNPTNHKVIVNAGDKIGDLMLKESATTLAYTNYRSDKSQYKYASNWDERRYFVKQV